MYRIRLHGRGGQGMKTASRILGDAFFAEGFEVQDAPRYGAERRGAPIFAFVRASREPIHERGVIQRPDLVVVADESLVPIAAAGVLAGVGPRTVLILVSDTPPEVWRERLKREGPILTLPGVSPDERAETRLLGAACAAAAARCVGVLPFESLAKAIGEQLAGLGPDVVQANLARAREAWEYCAAWEGCVGEAPEIDFGAHQRPDWVEVPFEVARISAPDVHASASSVEVRTGLWRTMRPVIDLDHCHGCHWVCTTFCPDGAIAAEASGKPRIDYDHCKGCLVCVAVCPPHAIRAVSEREAQAAEAAREGRA